MEEKHALNDFWMHLWGISLGPKDSVEALKAQHTPRSKDDSKKKALSILNQKIEQCDHPLKKQATQAVFGVGPLHARVCVVGEAPGEKEDWQGEPFVGRSGILLDKMLTSIGLSRHTNTHITNIVPWRPPDNRTPTDEEIHFFTPAVKKRLHIIRSEYILLVGRVAATALLGPHTSLKEMRQKWHSMILGENYNPRILVTYHPSFLLRSPGYKVHAWQDMQQLRQALNDTKQKTHIT